MSTRCLTVFTDERGRELAVLYRQFDGYPDGHGKELAEFLNKMKIVNGISGEESHKFANGLRCLAAQVIAKFKDEPGNFYLYPAGTRDAGEDYRYIVSGQVGQEPTIEIQNSEDSTIARGTPQEILNYIGTSKS